MEVIAPVAYHHRSVGTRALSSSDVWPDRGPLLVLVCSCRYRRAARRRLLKGTTSLTPGLPALVCGEDSYCAGFLTTAIRTRRPGWYCAVNEL